jgi:hypothetical protein
LLSTDLHGSKLRIGSVRALTRKAGLVQQLKAHVAEALRKILELIIRHVAATTTNRIREAEV